MLRTVRFAGQEVPLNGVMALGGYNGGSGELIAGGFNHPIGGARPSGYIPATTEEYLDWKDSAERGDPFGQKVINNNRLPSLPGFLRGA